MPVKVEGEGGRARVCWYIRYCGVRWLIEARVCTAREYYFAWFSEEHAFKQLSVWGLRRALQNLLLFEPQKVQFFTVSQV